jgi:asparagine synthase (glutamine-hydrolysing)
MCGLAGYWQPGGFPSGEGLVLAKKMSALLMHRGPDDEGLWEDANVGVALGHRRLSILDLSSAGRQPMVSASGRFVIAFNGEIYNHLSLREDLSRSHVIHWRGQSDTETLLAAVECWGLTLALQRSTGMFAFALWDRFERRLLLARDRLGEKPLYYGWQRRTGVQPAFLFSSELKAMKAHIAFEGHVDRSSLGLYMRHGHVPAPFSIYTGIKKLMPGHILEVQSEAHQAEPFSYWSLQEVVTQAQANPFEGAVSQATDLLDLTLRQAVAAQMLADVPLGAFLSGGIDSSVIVALMQVQASQPVSTFTIGFEDKASNEAEFAREVAAFLGTEHHEFYVSHKEAQAVVPLLPSLYDEPFADSSQIPTFLVSRLAKQYVSVALSGDGGDELFGGYTRYSRANRLRGWLPSGIPWIKNLTALFAQIDKRRSESWLQLGELLAAQSDAEFYLPRVSHWMRSESVVIGAERLSSPFVRRVESLNTENFMLSMMAADTLGYLPDDILVKVDRAAMGVGLETRVPLLDHRVVSLAWRIPLFMKLRDGQSKWLLRQVLYRYVPRELVDRPKKGFSVPVAGWLRGPLRDWAEALLDERRLRCEGFFNPEPIRRIWLEHLEGKRNWQYHLWDVLMFQAWLEREL